MLAGILKSPSNYAPHLDFEASLARRDTVLSLMAEYGYLDDQGLADAKGETMVILHDGTASEEGRNYYVDAALQDAMEILQIDSETLLSGGYRIYTAMDSAIQNQCEAIFQQDDLFPGDAQGAIVVQEAGTGLIRAMGRRAGGHTIPPWPLIGRRISAGQPGSVIKPVIAYGPRP